MARAVGIDISHHRPVTSWTGVINAGVSFVGIKATEGRSYVDPKFTQHRAGFRSQPFTLGIYYHFLLDLDPKRQAQHLMDTVGPLRANERLAIDVEEKNNVLPKNALKLTDAFVTELVGGACSDRRPIIYTSKRIWDMMGNPAWDLASEVDLWTPRWGPDQPKLPKPWETLGWTFWQFTNKHVVPGVPPCDGNYFKGDEAALKLYAQLNKETPS